MSFAEPRRSPSRTGILAVVTWASEDVAALYTNLEKTHPGRFVVGLGGVHGPDPIRTLESYLGRLTAVPRSRRLVAALGPRMYRMAREHAAGALPVLVTPERTAERGASRARHDACGRSAAGLGDRSRTSARDRSRTAEVPGDDAGLSGQLPADGFHR